MNAPSSIPTNDVVDQLKTIATEFQNANTEIEFEVRVRTGEYPDGSPSRAMVDFIVRKDLVEATLLIVHQEIGKIFPVEIYTGRIPQIASDVNDLRNKVRDFLSSNGVGWFLYALKNGQLTY